jgi:methionine synthase II (cobalamin-independent)
MMAKLKGLATGIGSLPHKDAEQALDLIFQYTPQVPFWPQLPKRDIREGMVAQFSENLPCLKMTKAGLIFDPQDKDKELEIFYEHIIGNDTDYFKISSDFALGLHKFYQRLEKTNLKDVEFIKGQVTGPFTFAASIKDEKGIVLLHDPVFMQAIIKGLAMKALWQIRLFKKFGKKIILFFDEPYLACFGSAYAPINRPDVVKGLTELTESVKSEDILLGIHCCGNTDWSIFTDIDFLDIISFDAFGFLDRLVLYANNLKEFLKRKGILCWGMVPTQEFTGRETVDLLSEKIADGINILVKKGLDKDLLLENLMLSPSCGLGTLDIEKSEKILGVLYETAKSFDKLR